MTERMYLSDSSFQAMANVICCISEGDEHITILDRTIFHPQGGGQPCDIGFIGTANVLKVKDNNGVIEHHTDLALPLGPIEIRVQENVRIMNSVLHSIGHIIGNIGDGLGWSPVKAHHWPGECRIEFSKTSDSLGISAEKIRNEYQHLIETSHSLNVTTTKEGSRSVSFGALRSWPCGGTHVQSLDLLPKDITVKIKFKKERLTVNYGLPEGKELVC